MKKKKMNQIYASKYAEKQKYIKNVDWFLKCF